LSLRVALLLSPHEHHSLRVSHSPLC
jgi:hypothetical protein